MQTFPNVADSTQSLIRSIVILAATKYVHGIFEHVYYGALKGITDLTYQCIKGESCTEEVMGLPKSAAVFMQETLSLEHYIDNWLQTQHIIIGATLWLPISYLGHKQLQNIFLAPSYPIEISTEWLTKTITDNYFPKDNVGEAIGKIWKTYEVMHTFSHCAELYIHFYHRLTMTELHSDD